MTTQYQVDMAVARLNAWIENGAPRAVAKVNSEGLKEAVEMLLDGYRELRQRDANVTTILIEAIARGVELRKVGSGDMAEAHNRD